MIYQLQVRDSHDSAWRVKETFRNACIAKFTLAASMLEARIVCIGETSDSIQSYPGRWDK